MVLFKVIFDHIFFYPCLHRSFRYIFSSITFSLFPNSIECKIQGIMYHFFSGKKRQSRFFYLVNFPPLLHRTFLWRSFCCCTWGIVVIFVVIVFYCLRPSVRLWAPWGTAFTCFYFDGGERESMELLFLPPTQLLP